MSLFSKKQLSIKDMILANIQKILVYTISINYMILSKRTLLVSEHLFVDLYSTFVVNSLPDDEAQLISYKQLLERKKIDFLFTIKMTEEILLKSFNIEYINHDYEAIWEDIENKENEENIRIQVKQQFENINKDLLEKINLNLSYIYHLSNYKRNTFILKESFIIIDTEDFQYVYITNSNLTLVNIKSISYYINDKKKYKIIVLSDDFFHKIKKDIESFKNNRVLWLNEIRNPFLLTYLTNNMTSDRFGDFNLTYFYWDETNPFKINCSIRIDWNYKQINYSNISDFDLNLLDSDIITLWWKLSWINTVTNLKVGRFSYRCLIIRKNWIYYLNLRKTEWVIYSPEDLKDKSWLEVHEYIIDPETNNNKNVKLDVKKEMKHFDIDFPLWYKQEDIDVFFNKLVSASKWTFWINGKTNSWKSTSLKNLLKQYYDFNVENDKNKNILMIENPIEWYDYYLKQVEVDDEDIEDYKSIIMWIKRADLDLCIFWELRTYDVFGIFNEISNSLPVFSTFHVWSIESFMSMLKYYSDKAGLNYMDVFGNVNVSLVQIPLDYEKAPAEERFYYREEERWELLSYIYARFKLNNPKLIKQEILLKESLTELIDLMFENKKYPIKKYKKSKRRLYYENLTWDILSLFITQWESSFSKIYDYVWYSNNILYNTLLDFIDWIMIFDNVKLDEYSFDVKLATLAEIKKDLFNKE